MTPGLARWWTQDLAPLSGRLRLVFYAGLMAMALADSWSPLAAGELFRGTDPAFYTPRGLFAWTGVEWLAPGMVDALCALTLVAWVFAALGLLAPWSQLAAGVGALFLQGVSVGATGGSHRWQVAAYSLLFMGFAADDGRWSLDRWLAGHLAWWPRARPPAVWRTGLARKLVCLGVASTLFAGGLSKLLAAGPRWLDGASIHFHIASQQPWARWPWLSEVLAERLWACSALSVATLALELGAPLALAWRGLRHAWILAVSGLHTGIYLVLQPDYFQQMWCYLLLVDWDRLAARWRGRPLRAPPASAGPSLRIGAALATALAAVFLVVALLRIEWWPLTHTPMACDYLGPPGEYTTRFVRDEAQAYALARACREHGACAWWPGWFEVLLLRPDGRSRPLFAEVDLRRRGRGVLPKQLVWTLRDVVTDDLLAVEPGPLDFDPARPDRPAQRWLAHIAPAVRELVDLGEFSGLAIEARLRTGRMTLARVGF